jgi:hypothetical protein
MWDFPGWEGLTTPVSAIINFTCAGTTGNVQFNVEIEAITPDTDTNDLDATASYATENAGTAQAVPAVAGRAGNQTITLTNNDSLAIDDMGRLRLACDVTGSTTAGDVQVHSIILRDDA